MLVEAFTIYIFESRGEFYSSADQYRDAVKEFKRFKQFWWSFFK
jgi:hypothetical protein